MFEGIEEFEQEELSGQSDREIIKLPIDNADALLRVWGKKTVDGYRRIGIEEFEQDIEEGWASRELIIQNIETQRYYAGSYVFEAHNGTVWEYKDSEGNIPFHEVFKSKRIVVFFESINENVDFTQEPIGGEQKRDVILLPEKDVCDVPKGCNPYNQPYTWVDSDEWEYDTGKNITEVTVTIKCDKTGRFYSSWATIDHHGTDWNYTVYEDDDPGQNNPLVKFKEVFRTQVITYVYK